jgi:hypothetical protein
MPKDRREVLSAMVVAATGCAIPAHAIVNQIPLETIGPLPELVTPGQPGDFNFLAGEWRISNWRQKAPGDWDIFDSEATVYSILGGVGSVEELRIPVRDFSGMGLRMLDRERLIWSDHWVNAKSGVVTTPGQEGQFQDGAGIFVSEETVDGKLIKYAGICDNITVNACRWRQASSSDGGQTWEQSWIMHWHRFTG